MKRNNKKILNNSFIRAAILLLVALSIVFSFYVSIDLFEHDCTGEDCPVCNFIFVCRTALKVFSLVFSFVVGIIIVSALKSVFISRPGERVSPVCLGVRLNN